MIMALAGGVGGAKLVLGLSQLLPPGELSVVGNTGDDLELYGLRICPDLDTLMYTLAGLANPQTGWGIGGDTFNCLEMLQGYGETTWFNLGDRDLATHIWRSSQLKQGRPLSSVTHRMCRALGLQTRIFPMAEEYTPTQILTERGLLHLQEYLVRERCQPRILGVQYQDIEAAVPPGELLQALRGAEAVIICPSNPFISIGPILAVPGIKETLISNSAPVVAVTPIVSGEAIKGPAACMLQDLGKPVSALGVAQIYQGLADMFVLDQRDDTLREDIEQLGMEVRTTDTLMTSLEEKTRLAGEILEWIN